MEIIDDVGDPTKLVATSATRRSGAHPWPPGVVRYTKCAMVAPAIQLFADDPRVGLIGVRFPVELRADDVAPDRPSAWQAIDGRIEYVGGLYLREGAAMPARFPTRQPDGSFCVLVSLRVETQSPGDLATSFALWAANWVIANEYWEWTNRRLCYSDDFKGPPAHVECDLDHLVFRIEGKATAKWWKDWLAFRLVKEAQARFAEIKEVDHIIDCPKAPQHGRQ